jgi:hypothetical protein
LLTGERLAPAHRASTRAHDPQLLDLFAEDNRLNVYAGELEVRPPGAPTTRPEQAAARNRQPRATCATDPGNAVRFVSRVDAEMTSRAFRLKLRLHAGFGMLELFRAA